MRRILFSTFLIALLLVVIYLLGTHWIPGEVNYEDWMTFVFFSMVILVIVSIVAFFIYRSFCYDFVIEKPDDLLGLRKRWRITLWVVLGIQCTFPFIIGLGIISQKTLFAVMGIFCFVLLEGILGVLAYWIICCFFPLPPKVKYIPFLKRQITSFFRLSGR